MQKDIEAKTVWADELHMAVAVRCLGRAITVYSNLNCPYDVEYPNVMYTTPRLDLFFTGIISWCYSTNQPIVGDIGMNI